jgi:hypothetical protein
MISATINKMPTIVHIMPLFMFHLIEPANGSVSPASLVRAYGRRRCAHYSRCARLRTLNILGIRNRDGASAQ